VVVGRGERVGIRLCLAFALKVVLEFSQRAPTRGCRPPDDLIPGFGVPEDVRGRALDGPQLVDRKCLERGFLAFALKTLSAVSCPKSSTAGYLCLFEAGQLGRLEDDGVGTRS
jgi:hypothetical protein